MFSLLLNTAFVGTAAVLSPFGFGDLLEYLICIALFLLGAKIIKSSNDKKIKAVGIIIFSAGMFFLVWLLAWQIIAYIVYLSY